MNRAQELQAARVAIYDMLAKFVDPAAIVEAQIKAEALISAVEESKSERDRVINSCALLLASAEVENHLPKI